MGASTEAGAAAVAETAAADGGWRGHIVGDAMPLAILRLDADLRLQSLRRVRTDIAWPLLDAPAAAGDHLRQLLDAEAFAALEPALRQALAGATATVELQAVQRPADGGTLRLLCAPALDPKGAVDGVLLLVFDITERRRAATGLRLRERQLLAAQRLARIGYWQRNIASDGYWASDQGYLNLGLEPGAPLPTQALLDLIHPEDRAAAAADRAAAMRERRGFDFCYRILRGDGAVRWLEGTTEPIFDADGGVAGFFGVTQDVTERRQAEERLRLRERQLFEAQRIARTGHWHWYADSGRFEGSEELYRIYGLAPSLPLTLQIITEAIHPDDRAPALRNRRRRLAEASGYDFSFRIVRPDGDIRIIEGRAEPMLDGDGRAIGFFGVTQDVTERRQTELTNAQLRQAMEQLSEGTALYDPDDRLLIWNKAYGEIPGHKPLPLRAGMAYAEVLRRRFDIVLGTGAEQEKTAMLAERMARRGKARDVFESEQGGHWYRIAEERLADGCTVVTVAEITQEKDYERQRREAQKAEELGRVVGGVAHEFNNVLTAIDSSLELIRLQLPEDSPMAAVVERALRASGRGAELSRRMLAYGRQQHLRATDLNLNDFVERQLEELRRLLGEGIAVETDLAEGLAPCQVDDAQLAAVVATLVENARDAMPNGGRLTVRTAEAGDGFVLLSLADTGAGMASTVLERVFEPFFTTKEVGQGTGLGLSMVQGFVRQSGGRIDVQSHPGKGTEVRLYLPRAGAAAG